jgi:hypothetical protein
MNRHISFPKMVCIHGKQYRDPKQAARVWVKWVLTKQWHARSFKHSRHKHDLAYQRMWDKKLNRRYYNMVLPIFQRMLS